MFYDIILGARLDWYTTDSVKTDHKNGIVFGLVINFMMSDIVNLYSCSLLFEQSRVPFHRSFRVVNWFLNWYASYWKEVLLGVVSLKFMSSFFQYNVYQFWSQFSP